MSASLLKKEIIESSTEPKACLNTLTELLSGDLGRVNQHILDHLHSPVSLIPQLAFHLIASGGKRLRPLLTLATARLCGYEGAHHITLATSVEFIHSATLLHDDVVDESKRRRGCRTANDVWGNASSVLVGDFLFSRAFQLMVQAQSLEVLTILSQAAAAVAEGEVLQLMTVQDLTTSEEKCLEVVTSKTAKLFEAASQIGGVLAQVSSEKSQALAQFGLNLGIAFQLVDDVLDYQLPPRASTTDQNFDKNVGDDFKDGKITLPAVWAYHQATPTEKLFWERTLGNLDQRPGDFVQALSYLVKHNALNHTLDRAHTYALKARQSLNIFTPSPLRHALEDLTDFVLHRTK